MYVVVGVTARGFERQTPNKVNVVGDGPLFSCPPDHLAVVNAKARLHIFSVIVILVLVYE